MIGGTCTSLGWISRISRPACSRFPLKCIRTRARSSPLAADIRYINSGVRTSEDDKILTDGQSATFNDAARRSSPWRFIQFSCVIRCARKKKKKKNDKRNEWRTWRAAVGEWSRRSCTNTHLRVHIDAHTDTDRHRCFYVSRDPMRAALPV